MAGPASAGPESEPWSPATEVDLFGKPPPEGKKDWSHRRAEPRALALGWTTFLLAATVGSFVRSGVGGVITTEGYRPAARDLMLLVMVGATLLWPLLRLSQARPRLPLVAAVRDYSVVVIPAQAILWPLALLARWPLGPVTATVAVMMGFAALAAAPMTAAFVLDRSGSADGPGRKSRAAWSGVVLVLALAGPIVIGLGLLFGGADTRGGAAFRWEYMLSPLTATFELTRDRLWTGLPTRLGSEHWAAVGVLWGLVVLVWLPLGWVSRRVARERGTA